MATGWDTGLCQDYDRGLGRWFADRLGAREQLRKACMDNSITLKVPELPKNLIEFLHQLIYGDFCADNPKDLTSALAIKGLIQTYGQQCKVQGLEQAATIAARCCSAEGSDYGNGYNQAAIDIERALKALAGGSQTPRCESPAMEDVQ